MNPLALIALLPALALGYVAQTFAPPALCPACTSSNYIGTSNGSLPVAPIVPGAVYDRFITIWLENNDFSAAAADPVFQSLAKEGILLTNYNGVTHPSEPNYVAAMAGDFFGMSDDSFYALPTNVSSMVDVLEAKNVSWASYQENMPTDGFGGDFAQQNYINAVPDRALRVRNFNDFAVDLYASALPQHIWITPNLVNDAHDTNIPFTSNWLSYWLVPLLQNPLFNTNRTLIHLTFDENESYNEQNIVYTVLLGGAIPSSLKGTNDTRFYTHYSMMSSVQNNWGLQSLGRGDTNKTMASVFDFQAKQTNWTNQNVTSPPMTNLTGIFPGPANTEIWTPVLAPNANATGSGASGVFYNASITDLNLTSYTAQNLTAMNVSNPDMVNPNYTYKGYRIVNASSPAAIAAASASNSSTASAPTSSKSGSAGVVFVSTGCGYIALAGLALAVLL